MESGPSHSVSNESNYSMKINMPLPPAAGAWTREPCDDVDPMPDYENVLTD